MRVIWAEPAEADLDAMTEYIARDNLQAALDLDSRLRDAADSLTLFPQKGKPGRVPGTRELLVHKNYILVYVLTPDAVQVVTILHAARQWPGEGLPHAPARAI